MNTPERSRPRRWLRALAWLGALLVVACVNLVPQQGWDPGAGPVVPHDTFPAQCDLCHRGGDWHTLRDDFTFDHEARTGVALRGAHARAGCLLCHNDRGPVQQFAARGCAGCHADPHQTRLGNDCAACHDERTWVPREAIARHDRTRFPLVGAHAAAACFRCHPGAQVGNFAGASPVCVHCHADDYSRTTAPNHALSGLSQQCESCHTPTAWQPARFAHPATFPLSGGHAGRRCAECHPPGAGFGGLSTACASCHADDFAATTAPNHAAAGFPTDCASCHRTNAWRPSTWAHPFPITNGPHARACVECHTTPQSFLAFSCTHCHEHRQSEMANEHDGVAGYVWVSASCVQCHPDGRK